MKTFATIAGGYSFRLEQNMLIVTCDRCAAPPPRRRWWQRAPAEIQHTWHSGNTDFIGLKPLEAAQLAEGTSIFLRDHETTFHS